MKNHYDNAKFERFDNGGDIDRKFSIDILAIFPDKTNTWASKFRSDKYSDWGDVTIEIMNGDGTKGDFYRFNGGIVRKYIYGWYSKLENKISSIYNIHVLNIDKLMKIPIFYWKGNLEKDFIGIGKINCYQNDKYGKSWFTAIDLDIIKKYKAIECIINKIKNNFTDKNLDNWM